MLVIFPWFQQCMVVSGHLLASQFSILFFSSLFCIFFALVTFSFFLCFIFFFIVSFSFPSFVFLALTFLPFPLLYLSMPLLVNSLNISLPSTPCIKNRLRPLDSSLPGPQRLTARCGWNKHPLRRELNSDSLVVQPVALFLPWLRYLALRGGS